MDSTHKEHKPAPTFETAKQRSARIKSEIATIDVEIANLHAKKADLRQQLTSS